MVRRGCVAGSTAPFARCLRCVERTCGSVESLWHNGAMAGRELLLRSEPGVSLPAIDRIAPPPPTELIAANIDALSSPGDVVLDLNGRGGWVARAAVDRQRRAVTLESSPLTRLVAEIVLRPPDIRHLDAAFQAISAAPRGDSSLKVSIGDTFATRCPSCGRSIVADEFIWEAPDPNHARRGAAPKQGEANQAPLNRSDPGPPDAASDAEAGAVPISEPREVADDDRESGPLPAHPLAVGPNGPMLVRKHFRCTFCRDQMGGGEQRHAPVDEHDLQRAAAADVHGHAWRLLHERFPTLDGNDALVDQLLDLHSPRQLIGLAAILERLDGDLRAAPVDAALRLALLHAILPASRLSGYPGRVSTLRIASGRVKMPSGNQWRERNPWLAFEDGFRLVRGFVQRMEGRAYGPLHARFGDDVRSLGEGAANAVVKVGTPAAFRALATEGAVLGRTPGRPPVRLVLGQPPLRPNQERLSFTYLATAWLLGREAAATLPLEPLFGGSVRVPWGLQAAAIGRQLTAIAPLLARDARVVLLVDSAGAESVVAAVLGGVRAGYRLVATRMLEPGDETGGTVEFVPPGSPIPGRPRTRANVALEPIPGGSGDPDLVPGRGLFAPPERFDRIRLTRADVAATVTETAVDILKARGEPASYERLLGEILVGLDRAGQLRRLVGEDGEVAGGTPSDARPDRHEPQADHWGGDRGRVPREPEPRWGAPREAADEALDQHDAGRGGRDVGPRRGESADFAREGRVEAARAVGPEPVLARGTDQVEALLELIRGELTRPGHRRLRQLEAERWWLASKSDEEVAATPLADRVEWAVFSLLATAGRLSETAFFERIAGMFGGYDLPDEALVRACLESYRSRASTVDVLQTTDDLLRRSQEHGELVALLVEHGHRLGMSAWIGRREQERRVHGRPLGALLDQREAQVYLPLVARGPVEELEQIDCIWYVRGKAAFLFEVEWTAMLHEPVLRRGARIPQTPELVRFLVVLPERAELVRYKLQRSPLLRAALDEGNWHILKANHLRTLVTRDQPSLADLEPYLGLDPAADRTGEQIPLFESPG